MKAKVALVDKKRFNFHWFPVGTYNGLVKSSDIYQSIMHGYGRFLYDNGDSYEGLWRDNTRHGRGKFVKPDHESYAGEWKHDRFDGFGECKWPDGDSYVGYFKEDKRDGFGRYISPQRAQYKHYGLHKNGLRHGVGEYLDLRLQHRFIGNYAND
jgi:hypothetical protein